MKKISILAFLIISVSLYGQEDRSLSVGVTAGPHEQILEEVKRLASQQDLDIEVVVFSDYILPNLSLEQGDLDLNSYQHLPFLEQFNRDRRTDLVSLASTVNFPMGIYSSKIDGLGEIGGLKRNSRVGIPNDPTNGGRALLLLQAAGVIKLKPGSDVSATLRDIVENPYGLKIIELEASQIYRHLDELAFATINTNYAIAAGLVPTEDSFFIEPSDSPFVNLIASKRENAGNPLYKEFIEIYQSREIRDFIDRTFQGSVVAAW